LISALPFVASRARAAYTGHPDTLKTTTGMKIISWNINGIRSAEKKGFADWLGASDAHIVGLQEVRAEASAVPPTLMQAPGWHARVESASRKGYSGVGLWSRNAPDDYEATLGHPEMDAEGRFQLARFGELTVVNSYFPNGSGKDRDNGRVPFKLDYYRRVFDLLHADFQAGKPVVVMGDFNTAHRDVDLARPKDNVGTSGFLPEERAELERWIQAGWVDSFRHLNPDMRDRYTWWSQRFGVRERNIGWRIDYALVSPGALPWLRSAWIDDHIMGSDHCPIGLELDDAVLGGAP